MSNFRTLGWATLSLPDYQFNSITSLVDGSFLGDKLQHQHFFSIVRDDYQLAVKSSLIELSHVEAFKRKIPVVNVKFQLKDALLGHDVYLATCIQMSSFHAFVIFQTESQKLSLAYQEPANLFLKLRQIGELADSNCHYAIWLQASQVEGILDFESYIQQQVHKNDHQKVYGYINKLETSGNGDLAPLELSLLRDGQYRINEVLIIAIQQFIFTISRPVPGKSDNNAQIDSLSMLDALASAALSPLYGFASPFVHGAQPLKPIRKLKITMARRQSGTDKPQEELGKTVKSNTPVSPLKRQLQLHEPCEVCNVSTSCEWRKGPSGQKTLCNACGLRYARQMAKQQKKIKQNLNDLIIATAHFDEVADRQLNLTQSASTQSSQVSAPLLTAMTLDQQD